MYLNASQNEGLMTSRPIFPGGSRVQVPRTCSKHRGSNARGGDIHPDDKGRWGVLGDAQHADWSSLGLFVT